MDDPIYDKNFEEVPEEESSIENLEVSDENVTEMKWKISIKEEEFFWKNLQKKGFTYEPTICSNCHQGKLELKLTISLNLSNPYYLRCSFKKCRQKKIQNIFLFLKSSVNSLLVFALKF